MIGIRIRGFYGLPTMLLPCLLLAQQPMVLHDGTPVRLRLNRNLSSADSTVGETADFEVLEDVKIGDTLVIARGGTAIATVTAAQSKRRMARGGKIDINIDYVRLVNDDKVALRAVKEAKGGGHTGAMTGAIVASSLLFFPAAPFFLFMHGKDISIPKGTAITAYVQGDVTLDQARLVPKSGSLPSSQAAPILGTLPPAEPAPSGPPAPPTPTSTPSPSSRTTTDAIQGPVRPPAVPATTQPSAKPMTNQDLIALKAAGFTDEFIIAKIKGSPSSYQIDTDDVIALRKANLSELVIRAMMMAAASPALGATPHASATSPPNTSSAPGATSAGDKKAATAKAEQPVAGAPPSSSPPATATSSPNLMRQTTPDDSGAAGVQKATARAPQQPDKPTRDPGEKSKSGLMAKLKGAFSTSSDENWAKVSNTQTRPAEPKVSPQFELCPITVLSKPAGANIFVEGTSAGRTPAVLKLQPGTYKLTLKAEGFPDYSQQITVEPGQVRSFGVALDGSK